LCCDDDYDHDDKEKEEKGGHMELCPFTDQVMNIYRIRYEFSE